MTATLVTQSIDRVNPSAPIPDDVNDWVIDITNISGKIVGILINGHSSIGNDIWQTGKSQYWPIYVQRLTDTSYRLYFSKNNPVTKFLISVQFMDNTMDHEYVFLTADTTTTGLPVRPRNVVYLLPNELVTIHNAVPSSEGGMKFGARVGTTWFHGAEHVQRGTGYWGNPPRISRNYDYTLSEYNEPRWESSSIDIATDILPPLGTKVWQINPRGIIRTSRITYYIGAISSGATPSFIYASLTGDGPYPGIPIGGDSGSICYILDKTNKLRVLGVAGTGGTCYVAVPTQWPSSFIVQTNRPTLKFDNTTPTTPSSLDKVIDIDTNWYKGLTTQPLTEISFISETYIRPTPTPSGRITDAVGAHTNVPDGIPDIILQATGLPQNIDRVDVIGVGGDCWKFPYNRINWWVKPTYNADTNTWSFNFNPSQPTQQYEVTVVSGAISIKFIARPGVVTVVNADNVPAITPTPTPTSTTTPTPTPTKTQTPTPTPTAPSLGYEEIIQQLQDTITEYDILVSTMENEIQKFRKKYPNR